MKEGWTWLFNSKRDHYFRNGKSLCGKFACLGNDFTDEPDGIPCATCLKKREKEEEEIDELLALCDEQWDGDDIIGLRD